MKKVINGKMYNTETAKALATSYHGTPGDFSYYEETLYKKKTGEYFLYGIGGAASPYSQSCGQNSWSGGDGFEPLTENAVYKWAEKNISADEYCELFGEPEE